MPHTSCVSGEDGSCPGCDGVCTAVAPKVVSEVLGHPSIAITGDVYGDVAPDVSREAMDVLGVAFGE